MFWRKRKEEEIHPVTEFLDLNPGTMPIMFNFKGFWMMFSEKDPKDLIYTERCKLEDGRLVITFPDEKKSMVFIKEDGSLWN